MRHPVDALILLALFALLAAFMHANTTVGAPKARLRDHPLRHAPISDLDRPGTRFDLLFREPELVR
jgi:hypothetical protein